MSAHRTTLADMLAAGARHLVAVVAGVVTIGLVARRLGPDALGAWALLGTASFLLGVTDLGLSAAVQRAAARPEVEPARRLVGLALLVVATLAPLAACLSLGFLLDVPGAAPALRADVARAGAVAMSAGVVGALAFPFRSFALVRGGMRCLAEARAASSAAQVVVTATWLSLRPTLLAPAVGLLVAALIETALTVRAARRIDRGLPLVPALPGSLRELAAPLRDGAASLAINLFTLAAVRADVLVLAHVAPLSVVAGYGVGARAVDQSFTFAKQVSAALLPRLGDPATRDGAVRLGTAVLGVLVTSGIAALAFDGAGLLTAWAGAVAAQRETALALALLGSAAVFAAAHEVAASTLLLGGRTAWASAAPIIAGSLLNVTALLALARAGGVWAAAGSTLLGNALTTVLVWSKARRLLRWSARDVASALAPMAAAGAASLSVGWALADRGAASLAGSAAACMLTTATGLAAGAWVALRRPTRAVGLAGGAGVP